MTTVRRLPAEREPQAALLLAWPHETTDWRDTLAAVETVYVELARAVAVVQPAWILCQDAVHVRHVTGRLAAAGVEPDRIKPVITVYNDTWIRDYGPICVLENDGLRLLDFRFDGWGGKFEAGLDDGVTARLFGAGLFGEAPLTSLPRVLEGGSLETDGAGTLLTTRRCLIDASRNPGVSRADWERLFSEQLGCRRTLWLEHGYLAGDDTDGHIDTLVRFADEHTLVYAGCDDPAHPNHAELQALAGELQSLRQSNGEPYRLVALPSPQPLYDDGQPLPASYANFVIINGRVLVPTYDDPADTGALERLRHVFPDREVIGIDARPLVRQGGALHCATMQIPNIVKRER